MTPRYFEDFRPGDSFAYGDEPVTRESIMEFARAYDPEPFHLDEARARESIFGGLIASGLHVAALWRRMNVAAFPDIANEGSPGWDEVRWLAPVRPGDRLTVNSRVLETRLLKSRPGIGLVRFFHSITDQEGAARMSITANLFVRCRPAEG
jgi:acyl dehydratase